MKFPRPQFRLRSLFIATALVAVVIVAFKCGLSIKGHIDYATDPDEEPVWNLGSELEVGWKGQTLFRVAQVPYWSGVFSWDTNGIPILMGHQWYYRWDLTLFDKHVIGDESTTDLPVIPPPAIVTTP